MVDRKPGFPESCSVSGNDESTLQYSTQSSLQPTLYTHDVPVTKCRSPPRLRTVCYPSVLPRMGISSLLPFVDGAATDAHLSDFAGQTAAVDGYAWLRAQPQRQRPPLSALRPPVHKPLGAHGLVAPRATHCVRSQLLVPASLSDRGAKRCAHEMVRGIHTTEFVDYCLLQIDLLRRHGVIPFVVLDGAPLPAKAGEEHSRRAKRERARAEANELLRAGPREAAMSQCGPRTLLETANDDYLTPSRARKWMGAAHQPVLVRLVDLKAVNITPEHAYQLVLALRKHGVRYVVAPYEACALRGSDLCTSQCHVAQVARRAQLVISEAWARLVRQLTRIRPFHMPFCPPRRMLRSHTSRAPAPSSWFSPKTPTCLPSAARVCSTSSMPRFARLRSHARLVELQAAV